jgi:MoxR-like ATPase
LPPTNLPEPISELIGRDDVLGEILSLASAHRLVTLTGAGGIGKTRLAVAAARRLLPQFAELLVESKTCFAISLA